jgi:hypothetical protein
MCMMMYMDQEHWGLTPPPSARRAAPPWRPALACARPFAAIGGELLLGALLGGAAHAQVVQHGRLLDVARVRHDDARRQPRLMGFGDEGVAEMVDRVATTFPTDREPGRAAGPFPGGVELVFAEGRPVLLEQIRAGGVPMLGEPQQKVERLPRIGDDVGKVLLRVRRSSGWCRWRANWSRGVSTGLPRPATMRNAGSGGGLRFRGCRREDHLEHVRGMGRGFCPCTVKRERRVTMPSFFCRACSRGGAPEERPDQRQRLARPVGLGAERLEK